METSAMLHMLSVDHIMHALVSRSDVSGLCFYFYKLIDWKNVRLGCILGKKQAQPLQW
eukprot:XP_001708418.1 Hypothetical protein GL50803_23907 [Giardia lamblia ATCC 50803]